MDTPVPSRIERFEEGVVDFFASLEWIYFTHYFPSQAPGVLLRLLTLSGLDSWAWKRYTMHLVASVHFQHPVIRQLTHKEAMETQVQLKDAVQAIWDYAAWREALVGEPPLSPIYLTAFGYTQQAYLSDLHLVYANLPDIRYMTRWSDTANHPLRPAQPSNFAHGAVAMMGATAGAIAYLVKGGTVDGDSN